MGTLADVVALLPGDAHVGYAPTGAVPPYTVVRPYHTDSDASWQALDGSSLAWSSSFMAYCRADSVEASYNLAVLVMQALVGQRLGGGVAQVSMVYTGAVIEGSYETAVEVELVTGELL